MKRNNNKIILEQKHLDLYIGIDDFNINNVLFLELVKNKIIDGYFSNIVFSDSCVIINGLYIKLDSSVYKKHNVVKMLIHIEEQIIELYTHTFDCSIKKPIYVVKDFFEDPENLRYFFNRIVNTHALKLSGVWESKTSFGINHKFIKTTSFVTVQ
jgi:hypothetical protein